MRKKFIFIVILAVFCIFLFGLLLFIKNKQKPEELPKELELTYSKRFKRGITLAKAEKILKEAQEMTDVSIKYPKELPKNYKVLAVDLRNRDFLTGQEKESIDIYYGVKTSKSFQYYLDYRKLLEYVVTEKNLPEFFDSIFKLREEPKAFSIKIQESGNDIIFNDFGEPKKIKLENENDGYFWGLPHKENLEENLLWAEFPFKNALYFGYAVSGEKTYFYLINSNLSEKEMTEIANSIIKEENNIKK